MFIILTGSSGVGKNTVIQNMEKQTDNLKFMPTYTTRGKRPTEVEGYPFYYITKEEFQSKIKEGELIEYEFIHNNYYGSSFKIFEECLKDGKILIKDIGVEGAQNFGVKLSDKTDIVKIFLTTKHKNDLRKRLIGREEKQIKLRLKRYEYEQKQRNKFDYIILNENLDDTTKLILDIINLSPNDFLPSKNPLKLSKRKIQKYIDTLNAGKILKPIKVAVLNNKAVIVKGEEAFVASMLTNKPVAKLIVKPRKVKPFDAEYYWWNK